MFTKALHTFIFSAARFAFSLAAQIWTPLLIRQSYCSLSCRHIANTPSDKSSQLRPSSLPPHCSWMKHMGPPKAKTRTTPTCTWLIPNCQYLWIKKKQIKRKETWFIKPKTYAYSLTFFVVVFHFDIILTTGFPFLNLDTTIDKSWNNNLLLFWAPFIPSVPIMIGAPSS